VCLYDPEKKYVYVQTDKLYQRIEDSTALNRASTGRVLASSGLLKD